MSRIAKPVQNGEVIDFLNAGAAEADDIKVGDVVPMVSFCGVAEVDIPHGEMGTVAITKVWDVPSVSGTAFAPGDLLYWSAANKQATKSATGNVQLGVCIAPKAAGQTAARVKIGVWLGAAASS
jgi:predicted RecA/RadA family phage recombinase